MAAFRTFRFANGDCYKQLGQWQKTPRNGYDWVALGDPIPCDETTSMAEPVGSISSKTPRKEAMPQRFLADTGARPVSITVTENSPGLLEIVNEKNTTADVAGCGCTDTPGEECTCTRKKLVAVGVALLFIAALFAMAYGVSKIIPD